MVRGFEIGTAELLPKRRGTDGRIIALPLGTFTAVQRDSVPQDTTQPSSDLIFPAC